MKMDYVRAADVLPAWLLGMVQEYAAGTCLYIPQRCGDRRRWGEATDSGSWYRDRNRRIYLCRMDGGSGQGDLEEIFSEREVGLQDHPAGEKTKLE